jgi:hypothetical protein
MDDHARGLVDDEEVLVGVRDLELGRRGQRLRRFRRRRLDLDLLATRELVALSQGLPVDENRAGGEQPLRSGPRADLGQRGEVAVEPLSSGLRRDEALQCFGARGSRSARASATSRMPTPITMKLSARLNAGQ